MNGCVFTPLVIAYQACDMGVLIHKVYIYSLTIYMLGIGQKSEPPKVSPGKTARLL